MNALPAKLEAARLAQAQWREVPVGRRLRMVRQIRALIARDGARLAHTAGGTEKLTAEVIPLAAAARFLEANAGRLLRPKKLGRRGRPLWLSKMEAEVRREPFGVVLIVGPANYPLFLPGAQMLQAIAAGNAVMLKPGRNGSAAARALVDLLGEAGVPPGLAQVLPEEIGQVHAALECGVDLVIFTGSTEAGRIVLQAAAACTVPMIAEFSGDDSVVVRADADVALAQKALRFGTELNGGNSCIAPHRVFAPGPIASRLRDGLPGLAIVDVETDKEAVRAAGASPFALGATIFSQDEEAARQMAFQIEAGIVVINDCIVPTADPRLPFGGRKASGFGVTRGAEGLLALTRPKVICIQRGGRFHLEPAHPGDAGFFLAYLQAAHGRGWWHRLRWAGRLIRLAMARSL